MSEFFQRHYTTDEINFIRELRERNSAAFAQYVAIVKSGMRAYDSTVNRSRVLEDPESITVTSCAHGHACILGPVEGGQVSIGITKNSRWAERYMRGLPR